MSAIHPFALTPIFVLASLTACGHQSPQRDTQAEHSETTFDAGIGRAKKGLALALGQPAPPVRNLDPIGSILTQDREIDVIYFGRHGVHPVSNPLRSYQRL